jgi:hypothetical protein
VSEIRPTRSYVVLLVATALALSGCQAPLDAQETGTEELYLETEQVPINNCNGPAAVTVHRQISKTIYHDVYVDAGADVNLDAILVSTALGQRYGYQDGEMETRSFGVDLTAPANARVVYVLEWREVWVKGIVYDPGTGKTNGTYRMRKDIRMQIADSYMEECP